MHRGRELMGGVLGRGVYRRGCCGNRSTFFFEMSLADCGDVSSAYEQVPGGLEGCDCKMFFVRYILFRDSPSPSPMYPFERDCTKAIICRSMGGKREVDREVGNSTDGGS